MELKWLGEDQRLFLHRGYVKQGVTVEERYLKICSTIENICLKQSDTEQSIKYCQNIGNRFKEYISKGWVSFATPVLANFGEKDNLPISCNHGRIEDDLYSIYTESVLTAMLAKYGAGTAKDFSLIRGLGSVISTGGTSESVLRWVKKYADDIDKVAQNKNRRGFFTAYLSVSHVEIFDFIEIGSKSSDIQNITTAVKIPEYWMEELENGNVYNRKVWSAILKSRAEKGFPYILFEDNCNKNSPQVYKDKNIWINNGNICIEAIEYCNEFKEFACCLSSVNVYLYDDWKLHPNFIFDMNLMLDCVIEEYITKGKRLKGIEKALLFAKEHRSIGIGVLGFHSYLQKNMIPFGSLKSYRINNELFKLLREKGDEASKWMAKEWGEPEFMKGTGLRNSSRMAQAPTKSTSFILDVSSGVEPIKSNYHEKALAKIQSEYKNPELLKLLDSKGLNNGEIWWSILNNNGSVQHLKCLNEEEKDVFKTFSEISQVDIIKLAGQRQKYIDMGQSINLMIHPKTPAKEVNKLHLLAYKEGLKSLYYQYSINAAQEYNQSLLECSACEA